MSYKILTHSAFLLEILAISYKKAICIRGCKQKRVESKRGRVTSLFRLNKSWRIALLCLLLIIALGLLAFTAMQTLAQVRSFQQHSYAVRAGDVSTIRPWMTLHTVSRIYHVPESYLYQELQVPKTNSRTTINAIAKTKHQSVNVVIQSVQHAVTKYRKTHAPTSLPLRFRDGNKKLLSFSGRRREV